ncbi:TetR/AcrR family transcriptional regulator (plasmid) [Deinococcus taeanensis]|uniref:TetR/AcrR family transcriptional regulator n=1 Tax=Deinococcus taeanensis TaxID=2737050 RepID=UPI001CDBB479|nr:TetR/AcrR family transcriptional regulator [Deinococcus taeanensis]UBV45068.1 TetR/AcrR family transcriptional regulator [Deinococcus taeanensis]
MSDPADTRTQILDIAQRLMQERGYHAVSYKDIGAHLGIRNASIHYHYPTKTDLGVSLLQRYRAQLSGVLSGLAHLPPARQLDEYVAAYRAVVHDDGRICLCTVLAAEDCTLPAPVRAELRAFFDLNERWLTQTLDQGRQSGDLHYGGEPADTAATFLATLEGAMLLARTAADPRRFDRIAHHSVAALRAA